MCPVCTVAVGVGVGLSRWLKIDDIISGLWIGALIVSFSLILANQTKKFFSIKIAAVLYILIFFLSTVFPMKYLGVIGHPLNTFYGFDKLIFGIVVGMVVFCLSLFVHLGLKRYHGQKSYFPFQKVVIPLLVLLIFSMVFYEFLKNFRIY